MQFLAELFPRTLNPEFGVNMQAKRFLQVLMCLSIYFVVLFIMCFQHLGTSWQTHFISEGRRRPFIARNSYTGERVMKRQKDAGLEDVFEVVGQSFQNTSDSACEVGHLRDTINDASSVGSLRGTSKRCVGKGDNCTGRGDNCNTKGGNDTAFRVDLADGGMLNRRASPDDGDFQWVDADGGLRVYAAHYDDVRVPPVVLVVAIRSEEFDPADGVICHFTNSADQDEAWEAKTYGKLVDLPGADNKLYLAVYVICPIREVTSRPQHLSLILHFNSLPNSLTVTYPAAGPPAHQVALCVPPVHSGYDIWRQTVETFELLRLLGVSLAHVYVEQAGVNLTRVFQYYAARGFLRLHSWRRPPAPIHTFGHLAAIHDCLLRMRHVAHYVAFADLDETIIPRVHATWPEMLRDVRVQEEEKGQRVGAFLFQNAFFHAVPNATSERSPARRWKNRRNVRSTLTKQQMKKAKGLGLVTATRLHRGQIWPVKKRSKAIVDPLKVHYLFIHYPVLLVENFSIVTVHHDLGLLHHYRSKWDRGPEETAWDDGALRFVPPLTERVLTTLRNLLL